MIHGVISLERWLDHVSKVETMEDYAIATGARGVDRMQQHLALYATKSRDRRQKIEVHGVFHVRGQVAIAAANNRGEKTVFLDTGVQDHDDHDDQEVRY